VPPLSASSFSAPAATGRVIGRASARRVSAWLAASTLGLVVTALVVGVGSGLGAAGFRALI
jgi:hypothetical protein